ncbi:MAG TPA: hypothetical protein VG890_11170 [Puia sp.]|nr:hypothetical protein [Puia sp.]
MKAIFKPLLLLTGLVLLMSVGRTQNDMPGAADRAAKMTDWMKTNLKLNDSQVQQVQDINLKYANKMDELKASTAARRQKMQTMKSDAAAKDAELKAVLTDDQYKAYSAKKKEMTKEAKEKMKEAKQQ